MSDWYAVYCKPKQDARAEMHLRNQGYHVFRPLIRKRKCVRGHMCDTVESLFPRYLFIHLDDADEDWAPIRSTRGVVNLVRWGSCVPHVPDSVIDEIRDRLDTQNCIDLGIEDYQLNERLRITAGPFVGYEGIFNTRSGEERVIVLLEIMQQTQHLELPEQMVERV